MRLLGEEAWKGGTLLRAWHSMECWRFGLAGPYSRPVVEVRDARVPETWTAGLAFSSDGRLLVTRGEDQCIKPILSPHPPPPP